MFLRALFAASPGECRSNTTVLDTSCLPHPDTSNTIPNALNIVFALAASIAVLIIVVSGFRYIAAHGDPNATAQARNSIFYAVVGLLVTMTAFSIVTFVVKGIG